MLVVLVRSIALLVLVVACLGLPLDSWPVFITLVSAGAVVLVGSISVTPRNWVRAVLVTVAVVAIRFTLPTHAIEEGHAVFPSADSGALKSALPNAVYGSMRRNLERVGTGVSVPAADRAWAFSADAVWKRSRLSRWRSELVFRDRWDLRIGAFNELLFNLYDLDAVGRADKYAAAYGVFLPLVLRFDLPATTAGASLCWNGTLYVPDAIDRFTRIEHHDFKCRPIPGPSDVFPMTVFAEDFDPDRPLAMELRDGAGFYDLAPTVIRWLGVFGAVLVLLILGRIRMSALFIVALAVAAVFVFLRIQITHHGLPSGYSSLIFMERGNDGLTHYSHGRGILKALVAGEWTSALRGGADVYYFMPGMRYVWAALLPFFGETFLGYLLVVALMPLVVFRLARRFVSDEWLGFLALCYMLLPLFESFGFLHYYYVKLAARGFGGGIAWASLFGAVTLLLGLRSSLPRDAMIKAFSAGFLCALAVACRPNIAPGVVVLVVGFGLLELRSRADLNIGVGNAVALAIGGSAALLLTLHNWYFGDALVPLTSAAGISENLTMPPGRYLAFVGKLLDGTGLASSDFDAITRHLAIWISPGQVWFQAVYVTLWIAVFQRRLAPGVRCLALALIFNHAVFLFYRGVPRYAYGTWLLSLLVFFDVWRNVYWPRLIARWPKAVSLSTPPAWLRGMSPFPGPTTVAH